MHAVIVREVVEPDRMEESKGALANVLPRVRQAPGIVTALFTMTDAGHTLNVFVFETEEAARGALDRIAGSPRPGFVTLEIAEVAEVLASF